MRPLYSRAAAMAAILVLTLSACGGGGSSGSGSTLPSAPSNGAKQLTVAFTGTNTLSTAIRPMATSGTNVSVTLNGKTVGSGQLDSSGKATIKISDDIPNGSTLVITAGSTSATFVWNQTSDDAAVLIAVNPDGTLTVSVTSGEVPEPNPSSDDPNGSTSTQTSSGTPISIDDDDKNAALPSNLPITVSTTCTTITIAPLDSKIASLRFEENVKDGDGGSKLKFEGAFTAAMTFPLVAQSARIEIELFDASGKQLLEIQAPVGAFTAQPGQPTPAPCPSVTPTASPTAGPSESPEPEPTKTP